MIGRRMIALDDRTSAYGCGARRASYRSKRTEGLKCTSRIRLLRGPSQPKHYADSRRLGSAALAARGIANQGGGRVVDESCRHRYALLTARSARNVKRVHRQVIANVRIRSWPRFRLPNPQPIGCSMLRLTPIPRSQSSPSRCSRLQPHSQSVVPHTLGRHVFHAVVVQGQVRHVDQRFAALLPRQRCTAQRVSIPVLGVSARVFRSCSSLQLPTLPTARPSGSRLERTVRFWRVARLPGFSLRQP